MCGLMVEYVFQGGVCGLMVEYSNVFQQHPHPPVLKDRAVETVFHT